MASLDEERITERVDYAGCSETERLVRRLLESEVLDPVWFQVLRNHPELQVDSDGKQVKLPRNHNLRHRIFPTHHSDTDSCLTATAICGDVLVTVGLDDSLNAAGQIITDATANPPVAHAVSASTFFVIHASQVFDLPAKLDTSDLAQRLAMRLVLLGLDLFTETVPPEAAAAAAKKAATAKKGVVEFVKPRRAVKFRLQVVDLFMGRERRDALFERVHDLHFDAPFDYEHVDAGYALHDYVRLRLSEDACMMSLVTNEATATCRIYELLPPKPHMMPAIAEERAEELAKEAKPSPRPSPRAAAANTTPSAPALKTPVVVAQWQVANTAGAQVRNVVHELAFLPTTPLTSDAPGTQAEGITSEFPTFVPLQPLKYGGVKLALTLTGCPFFVVMGLRERPPDGAGKEKSKEAPKAAKGAEPAVVPPPVPCDAYEELRWNLSHALTCYAWCRDGNGGALVALGQQDGLVSLWDVGLHRLVCTLGSHPSPVTCIATSYNATGGVRALQVVAGAADGTLSYYTNFHPGGVVRNVRTTAFVDFRQDVFADSVVALHLQAGAVYDTVVVQHSSGQLVLYSLPDLAPIGTLAATERISFEDVDSTRMAATNVPLRYFVPLPIDVPPPVEVPVDPKAKNVPPPEPVEMVEEEAPEPPPPLVVEPHIWSEADVRQAVRCGGSLLPGALLASRLTGHRLVLHAFRQKRFTLSWFDLQKAVDDDWKAHEEAAAVAAAPVTPAPTAPTSVPNSAPTSRKPSRAALKGSKLKDIHELSHRTLALTEERLEAHQKLLEDRTLPRSCTSGGLTRASTTNLTVDSQSTVKVLDMMETVKTDLKESKRNREARKTQLSSTLKTLTSLS